MSAIVGEKLIFGQKNGGDVELTVFGDEFYARYETSDGYSVVYDRSVGSYCYAVLNGGGFESSRVPISKPAPSWVRKHLKESARFRNRQFKSRYGALRPPEAVGESSVMRTLGPSDGLLTGRRVSSGKVKGLTILMAFQDVRTEITKYDVSAMLNDLGYRRNGNACSVREYFQLMSGGQLDYTNEVVGPVLLSKKQSHYINNSPVKEALDLAIETLGVKLEDFDSKGEGIVDALSFLYAGRTLYKNELWPHNSVKTFTYGNMQTHYYTIQSMGRRSVDLSIGTFTHETGHMLCRFPDLYDYGKRDGDFEKSAGLGQYCLMSSGNHLDYGRTPSPICAYLRDLAGWCDTRLINEQRRYTAKHGDYGTVLRFNTDRTNEYFLVENRTNLKLDRHLPDSGLAIYHCDTEGSNEHEDGTPDRHYQCALLQADGHKDLENDFNPGDDGDLFGLVDGIALSKDSRPSSREWDGSDSGFILRDIGAPSEEIAFYSGVPLLQNRLTTSIKPDLIIPDDDPAGVTCGLLITDRGQLTAIEVAVDITHTYRGDLQGTLISPGGTAIELFSKKNDGHEDLHLKLGSGEHAPLRALEGESISGEWQLTVKDLWKDDVGRLENFGLTIDYMPAEEALELTSDVKMPIPDRDLKGITSAVVCAPDRPVQRLEVGVDITHTYAGDLQLSLIAPSGARALLRAADVDPGANLSASYNVDSTPAMKTLVGEMSAGEWRLEVCDMIGGDTGTLENWRLKLVIA